MKDDGGFLGALAFFRALEHDPPDDVHNALAGDLVKEFGEKSLMTGLALVSTVLRYELLRHAAKLGCDCGSNAWLERMVYTHNAAERKP